MKSNRRKKHSKDEGLWLMSFSDMILTLMCFFLLLISTMKPAKDKYENMKDGLKSETKNEDSLKNVSKKIQKEIKDQKLDDVAEVVYDADGLKIEFKNKILFDSGSANLSEGFDVKAMNIMQTIAKVGKKYNLQIEGHSDDVAIVGGTEFKSNWELSASRGISLMQKFQQLGISDSHISVISLAHTRPKVPIDGLKGEALKEARAQNRRVVVRIE